MKKFQPRKHFGQHFLVDHTIIQAIISAFAAQPNDHVIEIGPGLGALTQPLLEKLTQLTVIEIDPDIKATWPPQEKLHWILADALTVDLSKLGKHLRIIGNLPYNISTPLLFHFLTHLNLIKDMHFMLQKEVVDRIAAEPGCKAYGRLSIMLQYACRVEPCLVVPPGAFDPPPAVDSAVVRLIPHHIYPQIPINQLSRVVAQAFGMRRKTLANNFKGHLSHHQWQALEINAKQRPEEINIAEYVRIAQFINESNSDKL